MDTADPRPLVTSDWLVQHLDDADLRLVHVSIDRKVYDQRHLPGAIFADLHVDLAKPGTRPETGAAKRQYIVPTRDEVAESLASWGVGAGDRVVFYDDVGQGRYAIRGYWLLRLYGFPADRVHVLDGGLTVWEAEGLATTAEVRAVRAVRAPERLGDADRALVATAEDVLAWSREASRSGGPTRLLDVRSVDEFLGRDRRAARAGRIPGAHNRVFTDFIAPDGRLRPGADVLALLKGSGVEPGELRAVYCQGGIRAALVWFSLHEVAGLSEVRNYAESWEEWGNRLDLPIE